MALKKLSTFVRFDWEAFADGKVFEVTAVQPWEDFDHKGVILGTVVEVAIIDDETDYACKPGESVTNRFEKLRIKIPERNVPVNVGDKVEPVNAVAKIYGDHHNQLSVKADGVRLLSSL